jgi:hypothetical protein
MLGIQLSLYFIKEKGLLDFATNTNMRMSLTPSPKVTWHQGHFADEFFRMFLRMRAICYSLGPTPCILKQTACIATTKNSVAVHYRVPRLPDEDKEV